MKPRPEVRPLFRFGLAALLGLSAIGWARSAGAQTTSDIVGTKHNLSISGPGDVRALTESRICIFCHTPHNGTPLSPLWNRGIEPRVYTVYGSPTLKSGPLGQPTGPSKLCLTCHDGTVAMGTVLRPTTGIKMRRAGALPSNSLSNFGLDLSGHHPVSFPYHAALPNSELAATPPSELVYGGTDEVHCITCHDPHNDYYGRFLVKDNRYSALCVTCHQMTGWATSAHATSTAPVTGILPRAPQDWPNYTQLGEWGCEACHTPHFAPTAQELLLFTSSPPHPYSCTTAGCHTAQPGPPHSSSGPQAAVRTDIGRQVQKPSAHHQEIGASEISLSTQGGAARSGIRSVVCADCHNPHFVSKGARPAPFASGLVQGVSGIDRNGAEVRAVTYEYEICFKCHADYNTDVEVVPRVVTSTNLRQAFDPANPSYHPVVEMGRNLGVPSLPSTLEPGMTASQIIACTTCHADDEGGSRGPHGSQYAPILKERYETSDGTRETYEAYALCYRCHERSSILADTSFRKKTRGTTPSRGGHSGHLVGGASCATCHDPHGVNVRLSLGGSDSGDHRHLINFDTRVVLPLPGAQYPVYRQTGPFSGSCTLVCHGVTHDNTAYP